MGPHVSAAWRPGKCIALAGHAPRVGQVVRLLGRHIHPVAGERRQRVDRLEERLLRLAGLQDLTAKHQQSGGEG